MFSCLVYGFCITRLLLTNEHNFYDGSYYRGEVIIIGEYKRPPISGSREHR